MTINTEKSKLWHKKTTTHCRHTSFDVCVCRLVTLLVLSGLHHLQPSGDTAPTTLVWSVHKHTHCVWFSYKAGTTLYLISHWSSTSHVIPPNLSILCIQHIKTGNIKFFNNMINPNWFSFYTSKNNLLAPLLELVMLN